MNFFRYLCLCLCAMMFFGAARANCLGIKCCICSNESKMFLMDGDYLVEGFCKLECAIEFFKNFMTKNNIECLKVKYYDSNEEEYTWLGMCKIGDSFIRNFARCGFSNEFACPFDVLIEKE